MKSWLMLAVLGASVAHAQEDDFDEEVVVYGDKFARWDNTRWLVKSEVVLPTPLVFFAENNDQVRATAYQTRAVINCEKDFFQGKKKMQVNCKIEDVSLTLAPYVRRLRAGSKNYQQRVERAERVIRDLESMLDGTDIELIVGDAGTVTNFNIQGLVMGGTRDNDINESLRQVIKRLMVGFDMKLRKFGIMREGEWVEFNPQIMSMPGNLADGTTSSGSSTVQHIMSRYRGHTLVQTYGEGQIVLNLTTSAGDATNTFRATLNGVAIYDVEVGYMKERVWTVNAEQTAGAFNSYTGGSARFYQAGRITFLEGQDPVDLGPSGPVTFDPDDPMRKWVSIEDDGI